MTIIWPIVGALVGGGLGYGASRLMVACGGG
jgi:hypothetical protein